MQRRALHSDQGARQLAPLFTDRVAHLDLGGSRGCGCSSESSSQNSSLNFASFVPGPCSGQGVLLQSHPHGGGWSKANSTSSFSPRFHPCSPPLHTHPADPPRPVISRHGGDTLLLTPPLDPSCLIPGINPSFHLCSCFCPIRNPKKPGIQSIPSLRTGSLPPTDLLWKLFLVAVLSILNTHFWPFLPPTSIPNDRLQLALESKYSLLS